jgi:hypothetical protein
MRVERRYARVGEVLEENVPGRKPGWGPAAPRRVVTRPLLVSRIWASVDSGILPNRRVLF